MINNPYSLSVQVSDPYVNKHGDLVIAITICGEVCEFETTGVRGDDGRWILKEYKNHV